MSWAALAVSFCIGWHVMGVWLAHNSGEAMLRSPTVTIAKSALLMGLLYWGGFFA